MRSIALFALLVCGSAFGQSVDQVIQATHAKGEFDGVVVISQGGKVVYTGAAGAGNRPEKVFRLASLTKQVTALLVMQEVAAGRLKLDQKAGEVMPKLPEASGRVTVRQLLQHVSGLANPSDAFYRRTDAAVLDQTRVAIDVCSVAPKREPGGQFEYNNCDYIVLGALLEKVTGKKYAALVRERVIAPLGLKSWGVYGKGNADIDKDQNPATYGAAGAIYGNALDVAKWDEALLGYRLLSKELTEQMFTADPKLYGEALGSWAYDSAVVKPPVHIVERQGDMGSTRLLNLLLPGKGSSIVIIANTEKADLFDTYSAKGFGYAVLKAWLITLN